MDAILASSQGLMPVVPVQMLRTSSLVGGLVEFTLGKNTLLPALPLDAVVEMHPFAVAGFVGCIVNSLSLLPLGREYPVDWISSRRSLELSLPNSHKKNVGQEKIRIIQPDKSCDTQ